MNTNQVRRALDTIMETERNRFGTTVGTGTISIATHNAAVNYLMDEVRRLLPFVPEPGLPCTIGIGGDRYAAEVVSVSKTGNVCHIRYKSAKDDPTGSPWRKGRDGYWKPEGAGKRSGYGVTFGHAVDYRDPSF